jgi:SAM-dependent methyltransferase
MLALAAAKIPQATFIEADLLSLPFRAGAIDLVVCGLALSHLGDLRSGIAELSRVLRSGGTLVVSVLHPLQAYLGWHAPFEDAAGARGFVREHPHGHADYLAAFRTTGLSVVDCVEPLLAADHIPAKRRVFRHVPEAAIEAYEGLPGVLVWVAQKD